MNHGLPGFTRIRKEALSHPCSSVKSVVKVLRQIAAGLRTSRFCGRVRVALIGSLGTMFPGASRDAPEIVIRYPLRGESEGTCEEVGRRYSYFSAAPLSG
jgi:hypothetical protein